MPATQQKIWCDDDEHYQYEHFTDFNEWLDTDEGEPRRIELGIDGLSQPSKALFASDREAYDQSFTKFKIERQHEALNKQYFTEQFASDHWYQRNLDRFTQLIDLMAKGNVIPFIGAGISVSGGFPTWEDHLREQGITANINQEHIEELLAQGDYETVLEEIEDARGREVFIQEMQDVFSRSGSVTDTVWQISALFKDTLITTNYDHLLEQAYDTGEKNSVQIINNMNALQKPVSNKTTIIKLHGDIREPTRCILSKNQYDDAYGAELDINRAIPKLLSYYYTNSSLLFLGCSLNNDRTVQVFREIKKQLEEESPIPQHFSIEQAPENKEELASRNAHLLALGITPIWFEKKRYDYVENLLRLVKSELNYRGVVPEQQIEKTEKQEGLLTGESVEFELSEFLNDFVDLMPLIYWLYRHIPQLETSKYLHAMQRIFHAHSVFTNDTDEHLLWALDHILRALSNNPNFDGYTHGKLSIAFKALQTYFASISEENHLGDDFEWNDRELLLIPKGQCEQILESGDNRSLDYHAIRLIIALLGHGLNQLSSPSEYCELPESVGIEFHGYMSLTLSSKLAILIPDRLEGFTRDINSLCEHAWQEFDKPFELSFINRVKLKLFGKVTAKNLG